MTPAVRAAILVLILRSSAAAAAQSLAAGYEPPSIGTTIEADVLQDLPIGDNVYALLETTQAEVIAVAGAGGLNTGGPARQRISRLVVADEFRVGDLSSRIPTAPARLCSFLKRSPGSACGWRRA
jgi:hypothetical protein